MVLRLKKLTEIGGKMQNYKVHGKKCNVVNFLIYILLVLLGYVSFKLGKQAMYNKCWCKVAEGSPSWKLSLNSRNVFKRGNGKTKIF